MFTKPIQETQRRKGSGELRDAKGIQKFSLFLCSLRLCVLSLRLCVKLPPSWRETSDQFMKCILRVHPLPVRPHLHAVLLEEVEAAAGEPALEEDAVVLS